MKKLYSLMLVILATSIFSFSLKAQDAGIYETYVILNINSAGNSYYDAQATTGNTDFNGANLGTFYNTQSLVFAGGQIKTWKNGGADVTGANVYYKVYKTGDVAAFTTLNAGFKSDDGGGNQTWEKADGTTNILSGLTNGDYNLEVYFDAPTSVGTKYSNNGGPNYKATFTIDNTLAVSDLQNAKKNSFVAGGKLYTKLAGNLDVTVYDMSGKIVKKSQVKSLDSALELNVPQRGTYIVKVSNGKEVETVKFIK
ncbi:T9SS type A sorting domain-containing protein [Halpernia sp.]|uniref:T9SS type A sorting domain-containing protein n=1 Tax=Halpernia sp. TaxID=2782209 RepID=UPI003A9260E7